MTYRSFLVRAFGALSLLCALSAHADVPPDVQARFDELTSRNPAGAQLRPNADEEFDSTAFPGVYAVRVSPRGHAPAPLVGMPVMLFDSDMKWMMGFDQVGTGTSRNYIDHWQYADIVHGKGLEHVALQSPLNQQLLQTMPTNKLLHHGTDNPVFIYYAAPDCPYCKKDQAQMEKVPFSYAIMPIALNPAAMPFVAHVYCTDDPLASWNELMRTGRGSSAACDRFDRNAWWDISRLFFPNAATPSFLFADGTVIQGDVNAAMKKAADMQARGVTFH